MKTVMEFYLPADQWELSLCMAAPQMYSVLEDLRLELRSKIKYEELTEDQVALLEPFYSDVCEVLDQVK